MEFGSVVISSPAKCFASPTERAAGQPSGASIARSVGTSSWINQDIVVSITWSARSHSSRGEVFTAGVGVCRSLFAVFALFDGHEASVPVTGENLLVAL
jgi:hypothetical protein